MEDDKITLDRETFKALAVDSRVKILRILDERQHTLTDLAQELGMAPSTIKEHLDTLVAAGLIKQVDKGMKWKYYKLSSKGKELLNPYEKKVWIVLATSLLALGVTAYTILSKLKGLGRTTVIEKFMPATAPSFEDRGMQVAHEELMKSVPSSGATDMLNNATAETTGALYNGDKGAGMLQMLNDSADCMTEECKNMASDVTRELGKNMTEPCTAISTAWDNVSTTLADTARAVMAPGSSALTNTQTKIIETGVQLPYAEMALFAACALLAGLCMGYLVKRKKRI